MKSAFFISSCHYSKNRAKVKNDVKHLTPKQKKEFISKHQGNSFYHYQKITKELWRGFSRSNLFILTVTQHMKNESQDNFFYLWKINNTNQD